MDIDWCLSCGRQNPGESPYCSPGCQDHDGVAERRWCYDDSSDDSLQSWPGESVIHHHFIDAMATTPRWAGKGAEGISAWARNVPYGPPQNTLPKEVSVFPTLPSRHTFRPPKLLLPSRRPVPPTLCMSTPKPTRPQPSLPITTPQQQIASIALAHSKSGEFGSMTTSLTDSIATPSSASHLASDPNGFRKCTTSTMFDTLATQVRSWVSPFAPIHHPPPPVRKTLSYRQIDSTAFGRVAKTCPSHTLHIISSDEMNHSHLEDAGIVTHGKPIMADKKTEFPTQAGPFVAGHLAYRSRGRSLSRAVM